MKIVVLGAGGQIGRAVLAATPPGCEAVAITHAELSIADAAGVSRVIAHHKPDWIVNAAAYTAVDRAEDEAAQAVEANQTAAGVVARAAARAACRLLHLSTDFVFDGETNRAYLPSDRTNPLSVYGATKRGGEDLVLAEGGVVLRTSWVYAAQGRNFVLTMLRLMGERREVRVVCDQIGAPTWASSAARAVWAFMERSAPPAVYHWTDLGVASWYDFAVAIQEEAILRELLPGAVPVVPIHSSAYPTRARRPAFSVLDTQSTRALLGLDGWHWRNSLRMMMNELRTT